MPVEQTHGFVQAKLDGCGCGEHVDYLTPNRQERYGCPT